jgi:hypothetical protein
MNVAIETAIRVALSKLMGSKLGVDVTPKNRGGNRTRIVRANPPQLSSNVIVNHTFRFLSTTANPKAITANTLLGVCGGIGVVANSTIETIASSVKLNSITIWSPPVSQGAVATCSIEWAGNAFAPDKEVSDSTISVATPARIFSRPPHMSTASFWQTSSTTTLATLIAPVGSIIDANISFVMADGNSTGLTITGFASVILGQQYYLYLDGNASHLYQPVSMTSTV